MTAEIALRYLEGHCVEFAAALHRLTGWPIEVVYWTGGFSVAHAWCVSGAEAVDANGSVSAEAMRRVWYGGLGSTLLGRYPLSRDGLSRAHADSSARIAGALG